LSSWTPARDSAAGNSTSLKLAARLQAAPQTEPEKSAGSNQFRSGAPLDAVGGLNAPAERVKDRDGSGRGVSEHDPGKWKPVFGKDHQIAMPLVSEKPILTVRAELGGIQKLGATPYGERRIINILGGAVEGPRLKGRILPGGADWQIVRADGVVDLRARYTVETESGGLILVNSEGYRHGPPEVMAALARDETVDPARYYFRAVMKFETADPAAAWLNRILALASGRRENRAVRLDVYEVL
jgi:hypothetical protein